MRRTAVFTGFLALATLILTHATAVATPFTVVDREFSIAGHIHGNEFGPFDERYGATDSMPVTDGVAYLGSYSRAGASMEEVYLDAVLRGNNVEGWMGSASASAQTTIQFTTTHNGSGPAIDFDIEVSNYGATHRVDISVFDLTTNTRVDDFKDPENPWNGNYQFLYDAWDSTHKYQLIMKAYTTDIIWDGDWASARIATDMFRAVPEPATGGMLLLSTVLLGVTARRRRG